VREKQQEMDPESAEYKAMMQDLLGEDVDLDELGKQNTEFAHMPKGKRAAAMADKLAARQAKIRAGSQDDIMAAVDAGGEDMFGDDMNAEGGNSPKRQKVDNSQAAEDPFADPFADDDDAEDPFA